MGSQLQLAHFCCCLNETQVWPVEFTWIYVVGWFNLKRYPATTHVTHKLLESSPAADQDTGRIPQNLTTRQRWGRNRFPFPCCLLVTRSIMFYQIKRQHQRKQTKKGTPSVGLRWNKCVFILCPQSNGALFFWKLRTNF